jgi:hypothetical protein
LRHISGKLSRLGVYFPKENKPFLAKRTKHTSAQYRNGTDRDIRELARKYIFIQRFNAERPKKVPEKRKNQRLTEN